MHYIQDDHLSVAQIGPIQQVVDGVFTAEGTAPSGEKIYFALETIEKSDKTKWEAYINAAALLVNGGCRGVSLGSLIEIGTLVDDLAALKDFLATCTKTDYWTSNQISFEELCKALRKRHITANSPKAEALLTIPYASIGINLRQQTHMVYASKSPITGRAVFTKTSTGFSRYVAKYSDLIMTVGVTIQDIVENRGIFRNPLSVVEGGYSDIAMMTHSFTCRVVEKEWSHIKTFRVRPLKKMAEIFFNTLPKDQLIVEGVPGHTFNKGFELERDIRVPIYMLANLYCSDHSKSAAPVDV